MAHFERYLEGMSVLHCGLRVGWDCDSKDSMAINELHEAEGEKDPKPKAPCAFHHKEEHVRSSSVVVTEQGNRLRMLGEQPRMALSRRGFGRGGSRRVDIQRWDMQARPAFPACI
jgi:hypothetical protein